MYDLNMNKQLGSKWFTFYTKIRPWLVCLSTLTIVVECFQYTDIYVNNWWLLLYFFAGVTQAILGVMVFVKSKGDYLDFVQFVKGVLLFETVCMVYGQGVKQYIQNGYDLGGTLVTVVILFLMVFFLWYRLNMKYFRKRIICDNTTQDIYPKGETMKIRFCRKCGFELIDDSQFCSQCGTKIIEKAGIKQNEVL